MKRSLGMLFLCIAAAACNSTSAISGDPKPVSAAPDAVGAAQQGTVVKLGKLSAPAPASWKEEAPSNKLRTHQFALPKAKGDAEDAELAIFFFGEGSGGSVDENVKRWKGAFAAPEGKTIDEVSKLEKFKVGAANVTYLDVSGTYLSKNPGDPKAKTQKKTNFRSYGVIVEVDGGPFFLTLTGPAATVEQHKKGFDEWLKSLK